MSADQQADLFREVTSEDRLRLLVTVSDPTRASLLKLLQYPPETAGGIMTTEFVSVPSDWGVDQTLRLIREVGGRKETVYAIYIVARSQRKGHGRELVHTMAAALREKGLRDMIVWVLRDNAPAREFYERLGGAYVRSQPITIGTTTLEEVSYGWPSLDEIR